MDIGVGLIYIDSQAAHKTIGSHRTNSNVVDRCKEALTNIMNKCEVTLCWVPGHSNVDGNKIVDELARQGSIMDKGDVNTSIRPLISHFYAIHKV